MPGFVLALLAAVLDLLAAALGLDGVRVVTKPLPALILAVLAWRAGSRPCRILALGLLFAAAGDELLLNTGDAFFLSGMLAFAAMHITYIRAYFSNGAVRRPGGTAQALTMVYAIVLVLALAYLIPIAGTFKVPLVLYGLLLAFMAAYAAQMPRATAIGGAIFMLSDLTLAFAKFAGLPLAPRLTELAVMTTYFAAQILIAYGMTRTQSAPGVTAS